VIHIANRDPCPFGKSIARESIHRF
jgi:hypothetical protein